MTEVKMPWCRQYKPPLVGMGTVPGYAGCMATDTSTEPSKGSSIGNLLKAILLVVLAIVLLRVIGGVIFSLISMIITAVVILALGVLVFGVFRAFKK